MRSEVRARTHGLVKVYRAESGDVQALRGIDLSFAAGMVTAVVGPSGSGKSTLLRLLAAADDPTAGDVEVDGEMLSTLDARSRRSLRRRSIGLVRQRPTQNLVPHLRARDHVDGVARLRGAGRAAARARLGEVGLDGHARHRVGELSGGEQQRLAIAVASVGDPALIVADEPTAELDDESARRVVHTLRGCASRGAAVVLSTHDEQVAAASDRVVELVHGAVHTERDQGGVVTTHVDALGRVQLPPPAESWFSDGRAVVEVGDGFVTIRRPPASDDPGPPSTGST